MASSGVIPRSRISRRTMTGQAIVWPTITVVATESRVKSFMMMWDGKVAGRVCGNWKDGGEITNARDEMPSSYMSFQPVAKLHKISCKRDDYSSSYAPIALLHCRCITLSPAHEALPRVCSLTPNKRFDRHLFACNSWLYHTKVPQTTPDFCGGFMSSLG